MSWISADDVREWNAKTGTKMLKRVRREIKSVVGDRAYDSRDLYDAAKNVRTYVVVPPIKNARVNRIGSKNRNKTIKRIKEIDRRR